MKKIMYFSAPWCQPCQTLGSVMDQVGTVIPVIKVNTDYEADLASRANVRSVPTVILVENDQEIRRFTGVKSYQDVMQFING